MACTSLLVVILVSRSCTMIWIHPFFFVVVVNQTFTSLTYSMPTGSFICECNHCWTSCLFVALFSTSLASRGASIWHPTRSSESTGSFAHTAVNNMVSSVNFPLLPDCPLHLHTSVERHPWPGIQQHAFPCQTSNEKQHSGQWLLFTC